MSGSNGQNGDSTRLDRVEALVEKLAGQQADDHERINAIGEYLFAMIDDTKDFKRETLTQQVLAADEFRSADNRLRAEMKDSAKGLDRRIADLVAAIGVIIARMPPLPDQSGLQQ